MNSLSDLTTAAINLAIETTANSHAVEQENTKLREQLSKNMQLINDFDIAAPRTQRLQTQLREKEALLEQKRKELVDVQSSIISTLKNQAANPNQGQPSLESIPIVMNHVQKFITDLTETAVNEKTIAVPVLSLFKVTDAINKLYDTLANSNIIDESPEEKEARIRHFVESQQDILTKLRAIVQSAQDAALEEEEEEAEQNKGPKIEDITDAPTEATNEQQPPQPQSQPEPQPEATDAASTDGQTPPAPQ